MVEEKIVRAHNTLLDVMVSGDGAIKMGKALILLREAVEEIRKEKQNEQTVDE